MSCFDYQAIIPEGDEIPIGYIDDEFPGCGGCTFCYSEHSQDTDRKEIQRKAEQWFNDNKLTFICDWVNQDGKKGSFRFWSNSSEKAKEVMNRSIWDLVSCEIRQE